MEQPKHMFCMKQFKPAILGILVLTVVVVGWTLYRGSTETHEAALGPTMHGLHEGVAPRHQGLHPLQPPCPNGGTHICPGPDAGMHQGGAMRAATAGPIRPDQKAPHPDWGGCSRCHQILAPAPAKPAAMTVATAPPIRLDQKAPHPDWGACTRCHDIIGAGAGKQVAAVIGTATAAPPLGIWIRPLTPALADQLGMDNPDGVLISGVHDPSPAGAAGVQVGDVITRIDNKKVENVIDAQAVIADKVGQDSIKLTILRDGRLRKIFVPIQSTGASAPGVLAAATAPAGSRVAVAATGASLDAQVSPSFGQAPGFILYTPATRQLAFLPNGGATAQSSGRQAAAQLAGSGAGVLIAGNIGPLSMGSLRDAGIQVYTGAFGSVREVLREYLEGKLAPAAGTVLPANAQMPGAVAQPEAAEGKIAIAATGPSLSAAVADDLGWAPYLLFYDPAKGEIEAVTKTPGVDAGAAAVQTAHLIVDHGATAVIAGNISAESVRTLSSLGVFCFSGVSGQSGQAVQMYLSGKLSAATAGRTEVAGAQPGLTL